MYLVDKSQNLKINTETKTILIKDDTPYGIRWVETDIDINELKVIINTCLKGEKQ